jgi:hypothetical protein|tara:strand:+ start:835 stop:1104 length:270 start_codon:yes stop_codon:yes gene_type:complete
MQFGLIKEHIIKKDDQLTLKNVAHIQIINKGGTACLFNSLKIDASSEIKLDQGGIVVKNLVVDISFEGSASNELYIRTILYQGCDCDCK